jgi:ketosteroid isomerase-like protein
MRNQTLVKIDWQITKLDVAQAGDMAYTLYTYQMAMRASEGKQINDRGKDIAVWKKQSDGTWEIVADTFNSDLPLQAPTTSK